MTKEQILSRFSCKRVLVQDATTFEWLKPYKAYRIKTLISDDMVLFTPVRFKGI